MLVNGKEVNHLILGGETFDKSFAAGRKARVIRNTEIGDIKKDGTILDSALDGRSYMKGPDDIVTVIARYKDAVAILSSEFFTMGSWIPINAIQFIDDENENGGVNSPSYILFIFNIKEVASLC